MISLVLFGFAIVFTLIHISMKHKELSVAEILLSYILFFNIGLMSLIAFSGHIFNPNEIAKLIGWAPGNPFQFEVGVADLAFGVLGVLAIYYRGLFWLATVIGSSIFLLGDFITHVIQYTQGNSAPYNIGIFVWVADLFIPLLSIFLLILYFRGLKRF
jgi:hypothetical protein